MDIEWNPEISLGSVLTLLGLVLTFAGLMFAGLQFRRGSLEQRARYLLELYRLYFNDPSVRQFFYKLDYQKFKLDMNAFLGSEDERALDSLLYALDVVGCFVRMGVVSMEEVDMLAFQASRIMKNPEVEKYLDWLDNEYRRNVPIQAHQDARFLADKLDRYLYSSRKVPES